MYVLVAVSVVVSALGIPHHRHHHIPGRCKYLVTGASPLAPEVFEFMRICFGATVLEGYGMTETACTITLTDPADASMGHVGVPTMACEVKLEDIPEMNYHNSDTPHPRGEVGTLHTLAYTLVAHVCCFCCQAW